MCYVLSLSLSLSQINCTMAPKACKSTPAGNLLQGFESSSSFDPPILFHVRFHDEKTQKNFLENFQKCGVHLECQVILLDFVDIPLPAIIRTQGWESLLERPMRCPIVFIQEFYMASISLYPSLLLHLEVPVSQFPQILYPRYYMFPGQCILTTLAMSISRQCLETSFSLTFVSLLPHRVVS